MFEPKKNYHINSRFEFERNFNILAELLRKDRMQFSINSPRTIKSLTKIRKLPNNRIDLNTINELARTTANMVGNFENMKNVEKDEKE